MRYEGETKYKFCFKNLFSDRARLGRSATEGSDGSLFRRLSKGSIPFTVNGIGRSHRDILTTTSKLNNERLLSAGSVSNLFDNCDEV